MKLNRITLIVILALATVSSLTLSFFVVRARKDEVLVKEKKVVLGVPRFSSGRIAFIREGNVYIAEPKGLAQRLTNDATSKISQTFTNSLSYGSLVWSPGGIYLAFKQYFNRTERVRLLVTDGQRFARDYRDRADLIETYFRFPVAWLSDDRILLPFFFEDFGLSGLEARTYSIGSFELEGEIASEDPMFFGLSMPNGCGGGGRPDWLLKLSKNQQSGGMDGIRATFAYLPDRNSVIYSTGCEEESVEIISEVDKQAKSRVSVFDDSRERGDDWLKNNVPQELLPMPDGKILVGTLNRDVVLYRNDGVLVETLTHSGKVFGPVPSPDGKTIYFADDITTGQDGRGSPPSLKKIGVGDQLQQTLFRSPSIGAISNISVSPNGQQLVFTLIEQIKGGGIDQDPDLGGVAKETIYLVNADGSGVRVFAENAGQGVWSPQ